MIASIVAAIAAILGIAIGRYLESRSEIKRHMRDRRLESYEQVCGCYFAIRESIRAIGMHAVDSPEKQAARESALREGARWNQCVAAVWLYATEPVTNELRNLDTRLNECLLKAMRGQYSWYEWRMERHLAEDSMQAFLQAVRRELSRPNIPVRFTQYSIDELRVEFETEKKRVTESNDSLGSDESSGV